jgi:hypothetical protein
MDVKKSVLKNSVPVEITASEHSLPIQYSFPLFPALPAHLQQEIDYENQKSVIAEALVCVFFFFVIIECICLGLFRIN